MAMRKFLPILLLWALMACAFAWSAANQPPSCAIQTTVLGFNFTYSVSGASYGACSVNTSWMGGYNFTGAISTGSYYNTTTATTWKTSTAGADGLFNNMPVPNSGGPFNMAPAGTATTISVLTTNGTIECVNGCNITNVNATFDRISNATHNINVSITTRYNITSLSGGPYSMTIDHYNFTGYNEFTNATNSFNNLATTIADAPYQTYLSINTNPGTTINQSIVRSDFNGSVQRLGRVNTTNTFRANLYYQTSVITPQITYFSNADAYGDYYNSTDLTAYLRNNTNAYVFDRTTQQWYLVPAVQVGSFSNILLISVVLVPGSASGNVSRPYIPNYLTCRQQGDQYIINASWPTSVSNLLVFQNNTVVNSTANSSATFFASINATLYPNINYSVNGNTTCARTNATGFLPLAGFNTATLGAGRYVVEIFMLVSIGISVVQPFALIFPVGLNDMFGIVTPLQMGLVCALVITISIIINGFERVNTVKGIVVYTLLLCGIMTQVYLNAGIDSTPIQDVSADFAAITTNDPTLSPWSFLANSFGFIISMFLLLLSLPAIAINSVLGPTCQYIAPMCGPAVSIGLMVILGLVAWFWLKSYEVETNRFRDV